MKNQFLNHIIYGIVILTLTNCQNKTNTQTESYIQTKSQSEFVYSKGDKKIEMILELGRDVELVIGKPINANFKTENINKQNLMVFGPGIKVNKTDKNGFRFTITPIEKNLVDGNLEIKVTERIENGDNFTHKFLVPVKTKAE